MVQHTQTKPLGKGTEECALGAEMTWIREGWKCYIDPSDKNIWHAAERQRRRALVFQIFIHLHQAASLVLPELWVTSYSHLNDIKRGWGKAIKKPSCQLEGETVKERSVKNLYIAIRVCCRTWCGIRWARYERCMFSLFWGFGFLGYFFFQRNNSLLYGRC